MQNQHFQHPSQYSFQPTEIHNGRKVLPHGPDFTVSTSGRAIPVATANQTVIPSKGSLFVGDISFFCTEADMVRLFEPYGRVLHVEVRRNAAGESLRHGFAELASVDAAQRAINDLHSSKFMGRRIRVHWACVHVDKRQPRDRTTWTQIYVSFCALRRERIVTEALLDDIFSHFGPVADVTVKKHSLVAPAAMSSSPMSYFSSSSSSPTASLSSLHSSAATPVWTGYAFVYFYDRQDAERATQALRTFESEDLRLACSLSLRASLSGEAAGSQHGYPALRPQIPIAQPPRLHDDLVARPVRLALQPPPQPFGLPFQADYGFFQSKLGPQTDVHPLGEAYAHPLGETYEPRGLEITPPSAMQPPMHFGAPGHAALW